MSRKHPEFQPGLILLDILTGAFRASGTTFQTWCKENGYSAMNVRNAALGQSRSEAARRALEQAIDAAGRDFILKMYRDRVLAHAADLQKGAA